MKNYFKRLAKRLGRGLDNAGKSIHEKSQTAELVMDEYAYRQSLENLVMNSDRKAPPHELFAKVSDGLWFWLCAEGWKRDTFLNKVLPSMPPEELQYRFTGNAGRDVMREGYKGYRLFRDEYEKHVERPIGEADAILDFGCGWGRIIRFFLKDIHHENIWGVDPVEKMVELCRADNRWCKFEQSPYTPPLRFEDNKFDLIYAYSVFSHLDEVSHNAWRNELTRVLKPGGMMIVTTRGRDFFEHCAEVRNSGNTDAIPKGPRSAADVFKDTEKAIADYDAGRHCFSQIGTGKMSYWGEAAIPRSYVEENWTDKLELLDFITRRSRCGQNAIVTRKRA